MSAEDEKTIAKSSVATALAGLGLLRRQYDKLNRIIWLQAHPGIDTLEEDVDATLEKIEKLEPQVADEIVEAAVAVARAIRADEREQRLRGFLS